MSLRLFHCGTVPSLISRAFSTSTASKQSQNPLGFEQTPPQDNINNNNTSMIDTMSNRPLIQYKGPKTSNPQVAIHAVPQYKSRLNRDREDPEVYSTRIIPKINTFYAMNPPHEFNMSVLHDMLRKYKNLPFDTNNLPKKSNWISYGNYITTGGGTRLKAIHHEQLTKSLNRLQSIDPQLMPADVQDLLDTFSRNFAEKRQVIPERPKHDTLDHNGKSYTTGGRKSSKAAVQMVRGEGEFLINGKPLHEFAPLLSSRREMCFPLSVVEGEGKFNVFATVSGGGPTGQVGAIKNAIAKGICIHNPLLRKRLRLAGCITRDARVVERKKPGLLKARKAPTWVKR